MYIEPKIESSYYSNNKGKKSGEVYFNPKIGETIYNYIIESKPKVVVEFGVLFGYSTVCIAQALKDINEGGRIYAYDLWENFEYGHGQTIERTKDNLNQYGVESYVRLKYGDLYDWLDNTQFFEKADLLHIDINNDGSILQKIVDKRDSNKRIECDILFEGGIVDRDNCWWMKEFNKKPMNALKDKLNYRILNKNYPGISLIEKNR